MERNLTNAKRIRFGVAEGPCPRQLEGNED